MTPSTVLIDLLAVVVAVAALAGGAAQFVEGASRLAGRLGLSALVVGLTVVAFGTSAPEFAVTVDAALAGQSDISVGNVVGSNVFNVGFILGGVALVRALPAEGDLVRRDGVTLVATTLLVLWFLRDLRVGRGEGIVLLTLLVAYLGLLLYTGSQRLGGDRPVTPAADGSLARDAVRTVGGLAFVVGGAHLLVGSAGDLARAAGVSEWVIGVTVVAFGTSAPEFATSLAAARRGETALSAGNLVGSSIFNSLGVLGVAAVIRPLSVAAAAVDGTLWLLAIAVVATVLFWSNDVLSRPEGAILVGLSLTNWIVDVFR